MNDQTRRGHIIAAMAEILEIDPSTIQGGQRLREDLGLDSLGSLELLAVISQRLAVDLDIEDALTLATVDDACAFVAQSCATNLRVDHDRA